MRIWRVVVLWVGKRGADAVVQFGWVNGTTEAINSTLNAFYDGLTVRRSSITCGIAADDLSNRERSTTPSPARLSTTQPSTSSSCVLSFLSQPH